MADPFQIFVNDALSKEVQAAVPVGGNFPVGLPMLSTGSGMTTIPRNPDRTFIVSSTPGYAQFTSIQAAINSVPANTATGENPYTILIYPGTYTETITPRQFVNLVGVGNHVVVMAPNMTDGSTFNQFELVNKTDSLVDPNFSSRCHIQNLHFFAPGSAGTVGNQNFIMSKETATANRTIIYFWYCRISASGSTAVNRVYTFVKNFNATAFSNVVFYYCDISFNIATPATHTYVNGSSTNVTFYFSYIALGANGITELNVFSCFAATILYSHLFIGAGAAVCTLFKNITANGTFTATMSTLSIGSGAGKTAVYLDSQTTAVKMFAVITACFFRTTSPATVYILKDRAGDSIQLSNNRYDPALQASQLNGGAVRTIVGAPSDTVVSETAFGQAAAAGIGGNYSREDHTHGTPANPTIYTPATPGNWNGSPASLTAAVDRLAAAVYALRGNVPIL